MPLKRLMHLFVLPALLGLLAGAYALTLATMAKNPAATDFYKFYLSSARLQQGLSMYWSMPVNPPSGCGHPLVAPASGKSFLLPLQVIEPPACLHGNLNPPFFGWLTRPLAQLDLATAWRLWMGLSLLALVAAIRLITGADPDRRRFPGRSLIHAVVVLGYFPVFVNVWFGQVSFLVLLTITLSWLALRRGKSVQSALWLGLSVSLKPFVLLLVPLYALAGHVRASLLALLICCLCVLAAGLALGFDAYTDYLSTLGGIAWYGNGWNASLLGFLSRVFGYAGYPGWLGLPTITRPLFLGVALLLSALIGWLALRHRNGSTLHSADAIHAVGLPGMVLLSPLGWLYYFPLLIPAGLLIWRYSSERRHRIVLRLALLAGLLLTGWPSLMVREAEMNDLPSWLWEGSRYCYGLLIVFLAAVAAFWAPSCRADG